MKPVLITKLDVAVATAAELNMKVSGEAESAKIEEAQSWMREQPEYKDAAFKSYLQYKGVQINASATPIGGDGIALKMLSIT